MGSLNTDGSRIEQNRYAVKNHGRAYTVSGDRVEVESVILDAPTEASFNLGTNSNPETSRYTVSSMSTLQKITGPSGSIVGRERDNIDATPQYTPHPAYFDLIGPPKAYMGVIPYAGYGIGFLNVPYAVRQSEIWKVHDDGPINSSNTHSNLESIAYLQAAAGQVRPRHRPLTAQHFSLHTLTGCRFFNGVIEQVNASDHALISRTAVTGLNAPAVMCGVQYHYDLGDRTFKFVEGSGVNQIITDTNITPDVNKTYWCDVDISSINDIEIRLLDGRRNTLLASKRVTTSPFPIDMPIRTLSVIKNVESGVVRTFGHLNAVQIPRWN